jgi:heme/copper-type cytochrome/quinol oxidase subunit 1
MSEVSRSTEANRVPVFGYNAGTLFAVAAAVGIPIAVLTQRMQPTFNIPVLNTYFVVIHVPLLWVAVLLQAIFAAIYFALPSLTHGSWKQTLSRLHFWLTCGAAAIIAVTPIVVHRAVPSNGWREIPDDLMASGMIFLLAGQVPFFLLFTKDKVKRA